MVKDFLNGGLKMGGVTVFKRAISTAASSWAGKYSYLGILRGDWKRGGLLMSGGERRTNPPMYNEDRKQQTDNIPNR